MRKAVHTLICLLLLIYAAVPALPAFICTSMERARLSHPCCPSSLESDDGYPPETPSISARCCQPAQAVKLEVQRPPQVRARLLAPVAQLLAYLTLPQPRPQKSELLRAFREARPPDKGPRRDCPILRI